MFPRHKCQGWNLFPIKQPHNIPDKYLPYKNTDTMQATFFMTQTSCFLKSLTNENDKKNVIRSG